MKKKFFILLLLSITIIGCGQQQKAVINSDPSDEGGSSGSVSRAAEKANDSKNAADSKSDEMKLVTDSRDGKQYKTVIIGTQIWIAENLNYNTSGSRCYDDIPANCDKYGRLYNWVAAKSSCPKGWHLPSNAEWDALYRFVDGTSSTDSPYESMTGGKYLKVKNGFFALLGGFGSSDGSFSYAGNNGVWWSASEYDAYYAYNRHIIYTEDYAYWSYNDKSSLFSVRCLKD
jgi:uncharacterized protein (TIGR02145 family)